MISDAAMMTLGAFLVVYVALVVAVLLQIRSWSRDSEKRAEEHERRHQETMVDLAISSLRREEEHARRMRALATPVRPETGNQHPGAT